MTVELISVGTEILLGDILNTNAQYLSERLAELGISVIHQSTVGDNPKRLAETLEIALSRSDAVITTGGLGPTSDDLTKEVCAEFFGYPLELDKKSLEKIEAYFLSKGTKMPETNAKQALMPKDCIIFENNNGTAPGCVMEKNGKIIIVLPGPPREMKAMFEDSAVPYLKQFSSGVIKSHSVRTFGIGESLMAQRAGSLLDMENPTVAPYAKSGEALLRVTAKADCEETAEAMLAPVVEKIKDEFGSLVYGVDSNSIEEATVKLLQEKGLTVATAESCTGGLIAKRITDVPGASEVFGCGIVSYQNKIKHGLLGVEEEMLQKYTAVSAVVAAQMALGAVKASGADIGVSVTGLAGPDSDEAGREVGLAYIGLCDGKKVWVKKIRTGHKESDCRDYNRIVCSSTALNEVRLYALHYPEERPGGTDINEFRLNF